MTSVLEVAPITPADMNTARRTVRQRRFLMCPPRYFDVSYAINPWMDPSSPVSPQRALAQWTTLLETYTDLGHRVELLEPVAGLPDMVFAANGATAVGGSVLFARFATAERSAEADWHDAWYRQHAAELGLRDLRPAHAVNEAEGDFAVHVLPGEPAGHRVLAGYGFRTRPAAHAELARLTGAEVVPLELVDPRFYHLDVALTVLDDLSGLIAYFPGAFSAQARRVLERLYPDAVIATEADALAFGLNSVSDGRNVVVPVGADQLTAELRRRGFRPVRVDLSELVRAGGSVKCCTQEIRRAPLGAAEQRASATPAEKGRP